MSNVTTTTPSGLTEEEAYYAWLDLGWSEKEAKHLARSGAEPRPKPRQAIKEVSHHEDKPKKRPVRLHNEHKIREAILKHVGRHRWNAKGIRKLADLAGMPHRTARNTLTRMEADGQIRIDRKWGQGRRYGVYVVLEHPAWSDPKLAQSLALSKLSPQVNP